MVRYRTMLYLVLHSLLVMSAVANPSAAQGGLNFEAENGVETITGTRVPEGESEFSITSEDLPLLVWCKASHYLETEIDSAEAEISLVPEYEECSSKYGSAEFNVNSCQYRLHSVATSQGARLGLVDIKCPPETVMDIRMALFGTLKCTVTIRPQVNLGYVLYDNQNPGGATERDIRATIELSGFKYEEQAGTGFQACPNGTTEGTHTDDVTLEASTHSGNEKGLWID